MFLPQRDLFLFFSPPEIAVRLAPETQVGRFVHQHDEKEVRDHELVEDPGLFGPAQPIKIR